jgi:hypothetical protein
VSASTDDGVDDSGGCDQEEGKHSSPEGLKDDVDWMVQQLFNRYKASGSDVLQREGVEQAVTALAGNYVCKGKTQEEVGHVRVVAAAQPHQLGFGCVPLPCWGLLLLKL